MPRLDGKVAIVTGAGSGIGRAAAALFVAEGASVIAVEHNDASAQEVGDAVGCQPVVGSVDDPVLWSRVVDVANGFGGIDVAYLNAGRYGDMAPIDQLDLDVYRRTLGANIDGVVLGTRAVVPAMRGRGGGAIVATASVAGLVAFSPNPIYTLTKHAVVGFVQAEAPNLAADHISLDAVCPSVVDTPMTVEAMGGGDPASLGIQLIAPETIAATALDLMTSEGTGRCMAVRAGREPIAWRFPDYENRVSAPGAE
jgi:NAD(P)-dependent dehydrogenase (short-subunit alcohol dehydrogenase family)